MSSGSLCYNFCHSLCRNLTLPPTENKPGPSGMGGLGIISQLLLCKTLQPDFQQEEICSIEKDSDEIMAILKEMQEYMPQVRRMNEGRRREE
ncbi:hypothetical protein E2C01_062188 [Portunus trituberculatus]|uniref:Uncharacterized protein n=1 Tax=Portunus trituberculatus TaxID=210409 RepID=A0A5B7HDV8_PORTR|nr:hypothetical protein [Portunus trituberculatus]